MNSAFYLLATADAKGVLNDTTMSAIQTGFDQLVATVNQVLPVAVVASVTVIAVTAGVNFALKKVKGVLSKAS